MLHIRDATIEDCEQFGLITVTASHSVFIGVIPEELLDFSWTPETSATNWRNTFSENTNRDQKFFVAESEDRLLGFVWSKPWAEAAEFDATIQALYVLPTMQRRGIGRSLISFAVVELLKLGMQSLQIGCVKENPSCDFYRQLGGVEFSRKPVQIDAFETDEILFGWSNLSSLKALR